MTTYAPHLRRINGVWHTVDIAGFKLLIFLRVLIRYNFASYFLRRFRIQVRIVLRLNLHGLFMLI